MAMTTFDKNKWRPIRKMRRPLIQFARRLYGVTTHPHPGNTSYNYSLFYRDNANGKESLQLHHLGRSKLPLRTGKRGFFGGINSLYLNSDEGYEIRT